jgi:acyl-ACP thioesterase
MIDYVAWSGKGRRYSEVAQASLGLTAPGGALRWDGLVRCLQNVATNDWREAGAVSRDTWLVRRTAIRRPAGGRWPTYLENFTLTTWCAGHGAAWAERRTNVVIDDAVVLEAVALWVPVDATGHPVRLRDEFFAVYPEARERKVPGRVSQPTLSATAHERPWPLRRADLDVVGHINNAAAWQAVTEVVDSDVSEVVVVHHGPLEAGDEVTLRYDAQALLLSVAGDVRVSATFA